MEREKSVLIGTTYLNILLRHDFNLSHCFKCYLYFTAFSFYHTIEIFANTRSVFFIGLIHKPILISAKPASGQHRGKGRSAPNSKKREVPWFPTMLPLEFSRYSIYGSHLCRFSRPHSVPCSGKGGNSMPSMQFSYKNCFISVMSLDS